MHRACARLRAHLVACAMAVCLIAGIAFVPSAVAFPGQNGKIAFSSFRDGNFETYAMSDTGAGQVNVSNHPDFDYGPSWSPDGTKIAFRTNRDDTTEVYVMNADGTGATRLTNNASFDGEPVWSPDMTKIAFTSERDGNREVYVMNADGTGQVNVTNTPAAADQKPAWSPDGSKIAFWTDRDAGNEEIYVMNADGTSPVNLTHDPNTDFQPAWSPDGSKIAFTSFRDGDAEIYEMNANGSSPARLTTSPGNDFSPTWAPDGTAIAFASLRDGNWEIYRMNADGSGQLNLTQSPTDDEVPDWQSLHKGAARPSAASPMFTSLVPAYRDCEIPDRMHAAPLGHASCSAPSLRSDYLTMGTIDSNGKAVGFAGYVRMVVERGNPATPADEADLRLQLNMLDVRRKSDLGDYTGEVQAKMTMQLTDRQNGAGTTQAFNSGTMIAIPFAFKAQCTETPDTGPPSFGSTCDVTTSADAVLPGMIPEGKRMAFELGQIQVTDGGPDGLVSTEDNTVYAVQGTYLP
jgi:Tol biopolymer transport system component